MRALLFLMRENETRVQEVAAPCATLPQYARSHLNILDAEVGEEELIQVVAAAQAKVRALLRSV